MASSNKFKLRELFNSGREFYTVRSRILIFRNTFQLKQQLNETIKPKLFDYNFEVVNSKQYRIQYADVICKGGQKRAAAQDGLCNVPWQGWENGPRNDNNSSLTSKVHRKSNESTNFQSNFQ